MNRGTKAGRLGGRVGLVALAGLAVASAGGCWTPGGPMSSQDRYTYVSTEWMPQTVTIVDTRTQQAIWSQEVPAGQKLVMQFRDSDTYSDKKAPDPAFPDALEWDLWPRDKEWGTPARLSWVPKAAVRRVDVKMRATPEGEPVEPDGPPPGTPTTAKPAVIEKK
ncbi:MAG: hypothetical protein JNK35_05565 [Phycisphaerae bacterium]|nr:hypothetical protein [Phycisphaerae bacterium]